MPTMTKETVVTKEQNTQMGSGSIPQQDVRPTARPIAQSFASTTTKIQPSTAQLIEQMLFFALGALEVLLAFRFILRMMGANQSSGFVSFIYMVSRVFIMPFEGIFGRAVTQGIETTAVLEPSTLIAGIVYAIVVWGIVSLIRMLSGEAQTQ